MHLAMVVLALQVALLLTVALLPALPPRLTLFELLWAASHKPSFYPLLAMLVAGPVLTGLAWRERGEHRKLLLVSWPIFVALLVGVYGQTLALMLRILWWQVGG